MTAVNWSFPHRTILYKQGHSLPPIHAAISYGKAAKHLPVKGSGNLDRTIVAASRETQPGAGLQIPVESPQYDADVVTGQWRGAGSSADPDIHFQDLTTLALSSVQANTRRVLA